MTNSAASVLVIALMLGACGGGTAAPPARSVTPTDTAPSGSTPPTQAPSDQLARALVAVTPTSATTGEATGVIGPDAPLVLDVTGPDGTTFHAEFPAGASPFPVTVTMRPLERIEGLPGVAVGVSVEPAGLHLVDPGVLTIDGPMAQQVSARAFGYRDTADGARAFPEIAVPSEGPLRVIVSHFSGYGAVNESPTGWTIGTISATEASEVIDLERFVIANALQAAKSRDLTQEQADEVVAAALQGIADATERLGAAAAVAAATGDPDPATQARIADAIEVILAAERANALVGTEDRNVDVIADVVAIVQTYLAAVAQHCQDAHDVTTLTLIMTLSRQVQLMGGDAADDAVGQCTAVELRFHTTVTEAGPWGSGSLEFEVAVPMDLIGSATPGTAPPDPVAYPVANEFHLGDADCTIPRVADDGLFTVITASLIPAPPAAPATPAPRAVVPRLEIADATVTFSIGDSLLHYLTEGECPDTQTDDDLPLSTHFDRFFEAEALAAAVYRFSGGFEIPGDGSAVLARRTIEREYTQGIDAETVNRSVTTIEIVHTPA